MIDSYKGVRDFYPEDQRVQNYMFGVMRRTAESYGYEEYGASVLEPTELYTAKSSEEIVGEQTYTFMDRGGRSVTLRPEMTPTVARMVANRKRELGYPLRLYSIPNLFRYERTQRGRTREHWQLNIDLFGATEIEADEEIIAVASALFKNLGADESMFKIRINSRTLLNACLEKVLKYPSDTASAIKLVDRKDKMPADEFDTAWNKISSVSFDQSFMQNEEIHTLLSNLKKRGINNAVYDPSIVRGFDYYTGTVFEIFDTDPENNRALMGGGRYDNLIGQYGNEDLPACGFGLGDVTLRLFLESHNLLPALTSTAHLYLAPIGTHEAAEAADLLRTMGINVALGMKHEKIGDHIKAASKLGIPYFAVYGENEAKSNELTLKALASGTETTVALDKVAEFFLTK